MPYLGKSPSFGVRQRYQYTATAGQTTFSGTDLGNLTLTYTDNNFVDVYQNGVLLKGGGNDYTATSGTSVVLATGATADDVIEIIVYDAFSAANFYSRTDSDSRYQTTLAGIDDQSSSNDDQITITDSTVVINEDSDDVDFRVESNGNANMLFVDGGNDSVVIGHNDANDGSVSSAFAFQYIGTDYNSSSMGLARFENSANAPSVVFHKSRNASIGGDTVVQDDDEMGRIRFFGNDGTDFTEGARITALVDGTPGNNDMPGRLMFSTTADGASSPTERMRIDSSGRVMIATTNTNPASTSGTGNEGHVFPVGAAGQHAISNSVCLDLNRKTTDGTVVLIRQDGSAEGSISVSSSTVTFDGFVGRHESSGISTSTPKGTVLSTIDELDIYPTGTAKEGQTRADHAKVKVSDAVGDSSVYGVVDTYTDDDKVMVASVGIGSVRVTGACAKGDLLESNGDGTAKVQSDDIVRSKTIGKVTIGNSNTAVKLVSCVLYCG